MKIPSARRLQGFTLVELLVVIAIIAVLAAAGFAAGTAAINKARRVTALAAATAIETAINNFYTEYGTMPVDGDEDKTVNTKTDTSILKVLMGLEGTGSNVLNTRGVKFLSVKEGKADKNGLIYSPDGSSVEGLYDPWGGAYFIELDLDYDEKVSPTASGKTSNLNGRRAAVWSLGADGASGSGGSLGDDVKTW